MSIRFFVSCFAFLCGLSISAQEVVIPDTIPIYMKKAGIPFRIYYREWFFRAGSYGYNPYAMTHQDSVVMENRAALYFKVYDKKNRLLMCGGREQGMTELSGDIIFYYHNGNIKRIAHWDSETFEDSCGNQYLIHDAPGREGKWKYYRKDGSLKKEVERQIKFGSCKMFDYTLRQHIRKHRRNGKVYSDKLRKRRW